MHNNKTRFKKAIAFYIEKCYDKSIIRAEKKGKEMYYELDLNALDGMLLQEGLEEGGEH